MSSECFYVRGLCSWPDTSPQNTTQGSIAPDDGNTRGESATRSVAERNVEVEKTTNYDDDNAYNYNTGLSPGLSATTLDIRGPTERRRRRQQHQQQGSKKFTFFERNVEVEAPPVPRAGLRALTAPGEESLREVVKTHRHHLQNKSGVGAKLAHPATTYMPDSCPWITDQRGRQPPTWCLPVSSYEMVKIHGKDNPN